MTTHTLPWRFRRSVRRGILGLFFCLDLILPAADVDLRAPSMWHGHRAHEYVEA